MGDVISPRIEAVVRTMGFLLTSGPETGLVVLCCFLHAARYAAHRRPLMGASGQYGWSGSSCLFDEVLAIKVIIEKTEWGEILELRRCVCCVSGMRVAIG